MKIEVRWAVDSDGTRIGELADACDFRSRDGEFDWTRVEPYWLVATADDEVVAAIQILPALPVGRMDHLMIEPTLSHRRRGEVTRRITDFGLAIAKRAGAQCVLSSIDERLASYQKVAEKRGWNVVGKSYDVMQVL